MAARIDEMDDASDDPGVRAMLVALALDEQEHWDHPRETPQELLQRLRPERTFTGENRIFVARDEQGHTVGLCWVVLFDPGTGLEAEIAELYVEPRARGAGVGSALADAAVRLMRSRGVTFASVWTRDDNHAAVEVYRRAGFRPTEHTVLTWLPLDDR